MISPSVCSVDSCPHNCIRLGCKPTPHGINTAYTQGTKCDTRHTLHDVVFGQREGGNRYSYTAGTATPTPPGTRRRDSSKSVVYALYS